MSIWKTIRLIRLAEFINGYGFKPDDWSKEGLPIVRIEQLKNPLAQYDYYNGRLPSYNTIENGDLIFSWSASLFLRIWDRGKAALNQHLFKVIPNDDTNKLFLKYLIEYNLNKLLLSAHGSTMQHITRKELEKFEVFIPNNKIEQICLSDILSKADQAIEQTEKLIAKYQRIKTGLMQDLLTKGIDKHGNIRSEKKHEFKESTLGKIPNEWHEIKLSELDNYITSGSRNWAEFYSSEGALFVRITNLTRENINFRFEDLKRVDLRSNKEGKRTKLQEGDLLISITADLGIIGVVPFNFEESYINQHIALFRIYEREEYHPRFLGHYLSSTFGLEQFTKLNDGGAKAGLNLSTILKIKFPKMSFKEQKAISLILDRSDYVINEQKRQLVKLQSLKTGLMQDLLSGKVRVKVSEL